jgi:DNA-binding XRE family transcriptional regulator
MECISEEIQSLRHTTKLSQNRFGKKIGVSGKTISAYENGKCNPPLKVLRRISSVFDYPLINMDGETRKSLRVKLQMLKDSVNEIEGYIVGR